MAAWLTRQRTQVGSNAHTHMWMLVIYLLNTDTQKYCLLGHPGNTPLHIAAGRKLKEIVALLMAYGANPAIPNGEGDFPSDLPASLLVINITQLLPNNFYFVFFPSSMNRCKGQK